MRAPVSATATKSSSCDSATPLAKASPSRTTSTAPSVPSRSSRPVRVFWTKSSFHCSMPNFVEESENQTVPSEAIAALLQNRIGRPATRSVTASTAPVRGVDAEQAAVRVADQQPAVEVDLDAERAAPVCATRSIRWPSWADPEDAAVLGAGEDGALVAAAACRRRRPRRRARGRGSPGTARRVELAIGRHARR